MLTNDGWIQEEEAIRKEEEEEARKLEAKEAKKQREREKREELRRQGKLKTPKQREEERRLAAMREQILGKAGAAEAMQGESFVASNFGVWLWVSKLRLGICRSKSGRFWCRGFRGSSARSWGK